MKEQAKEKRGKKEVADVLVIPINMLLLDANRVLPVSLQEFCRFPAEIVLGAKAVFVLRHALSFKPAGAQLSNGSASLQRKTYQHGRTHAGRTCPEPLGRRNLAEGLRKVRWTVTQKSRGWW